MDGLPRLGWSDTLHRGNILHFHPQHIPGMDAAGLRWGQRGNGLIEPPEQFSIFGLRLLSIRQSSGDGCAQPMAAFSIPSLQSRE